jgi:HAD superfamily hydrolase (TIGR01549 family)
MNREPAIVPSGAGLKGVVFDLDDTLILSTVDYARFKTLIIERISSLGEDPRLYSPDEGIVGLMERFSGRMRALGWTREQVEGSLEEFEKIMDEVELERVLETRELAGARDVLEYLASKDVRIGILTRGCQMYAEEALRIAGLRELVHALECRNSRIPAKPRPEPYWHLVQQLGVRPEETIFVGDHLLDATCAERAGVPFVGVMTGDLTEEELRGAGSVVVFGSVAEMLPWLREVLEG